MKFQLIATMSAMYLVKYYKSQNVIKTTCIGCLQLSQQCHLTMSVQLENFICFDFVFWCLSMSLESVTPNVREIDNLYGFRHVFTYTHILPLDSVLFLQDRLTLPKSERMVYQRNVERQPVMLHDRSKACARKAGSF